MTRQYPPLFSFLLGIFLLMVGPSVSWGQDPIDPQFQEDLDEAFRKGQLIGEVMSKPDGVNMFYKIGEGELLVSQGRISEAARKYEEVLAWFDKHFPEDHLARAGPLNNYGTILSNQQNFGRAEEMFLRSLHIRQKHLGPNHLDVAQSLSNLGFLYFVVGELRKGEGALKRAKEIYIEKKAQDHLDFGAVLSNLAMISINMGDREEAEKLLNFAEKVVEINVGKHSTYMIIILSHRAALLWMIGETQQSAEMLERALELQRKVAPRYFLHEHNCLLSLGLANSHLGKFELAKKQVEESLKIAQTHGRDMPFLEALSRLNLMEYRLMVGDVEGLTGQTKTNYQLITQKFSHHHWLSILLKVYVAQAYSFQGEGEPAADTFDEAMREHHKSITTLLPSLSESEQLHFLFKRQDVLHRALSLAARDPGNPYIAAKSSEWLLNNKSLTQNILSERYVLESEAQNLPEAGKLIQKLKEVRQKLATLVHSHTNRQEGNEGAAQQEALLFRQERKLAKELGRLLGRNPNRINWVPLTDVRQSLAPDTVLVEFFRCNYWDYNRAQTPDKKLRTNTPHYLAWIIPPDGQGDVVVVNLGPADPLEESIHKFREQIYSAASNVTPDERQQAQEDYWQTGQHLADSLLTKVLPHTERFSRWIISPDGDLWLVPWAALPLDQNRYLVEEYSVHQVVTGRDLYLWKTQPGQKKLRSPLIVANPSYSWAGNPVKEEPGKFFDPTRSASLRGLPPLFPKLEGTEKEATAAHPHLEKYTGMKPILLKGPAATESALRKAHQPFVLHLATHGFFLDAPASGVEALPGINRGIVMAAGVKKSIDSPKKRMAPLPLNPLLRCGLVLAGVNHRHKIQSLHEDDGLLTGLEIVSLDLRGTDLVVLSACETSLGTVHPGEGVASLRQAFHLAGAKSVLASSWRVPDDETAKLMEFYFANLARGMGKSDSLVHAQRQMIGYLRKRDGAAHPYYWAAFSITGPGTSGKDSLQGADSPVSVVWLVLCVGFFLALALWESWRRRRSA